MEKIEKEEKVEADDMFAFIKDASKMKKKKNNTTKGKKGKKNKNYFSSDDEKKEIKETHV